jgi:hypothetical protein
MTASNGVATPGKARAAQLAFLLLFPGFFFYQTLIGVGEVKAYLGGYFAVVSIAVSFPLGFSYCRALKAAGYRVARTDLQFGFFLAYFLVVIAINALFGATATIDKNNLASILYFLNIYIIFKTIDFSDRRTKSVALTSLLLMSALIFYFSAGGVFRPGQIGDPQSPESVATYQGFARSYMLTFVAVISFTRTSPARILVYCIAVPALFLNGSRSELVALLCLIPVVEIYRAKSPLHILCFLLVASAAATMITITLEQALPESRVWELFNLSQSESANARHGLAQQALATIGEHPLLGAYASYRPGEYAHNILSAWVDLGMFGFAYMLFMLVPAAFELLASSLFLRARSGDFLLVLSLICISLLLLFTAKNFTDMCAGAALGAYANYKSKRATPSYKEGFGSRLEKVK